MVEFLCCGLDSKGNTLISKEIQRLEKENQRLKTQLYREIKINRKMENALKEYADKNFWYGRDDENGWEVAEETLKEIGE